MIINWSPEKIHHVESLASFGDRVDLEETSKDFLLHVFSAKQISDQIKTIIFHLSPPFRDYSGEPPWVSPPPPLHWAHCLGGRCGCIKTFNTLCFNNHHNCQCYKIIATKKKQKQKQKMHLSTVF